jgi:hypothetical protein
MDAFSSIIKVGDSHKRAETARASQGSLEMSENGLAQREVTSNHQQSNTPRIINARFQESLKPATRFDPKSQKSDGKNINNEFGGLRFKPGDVFLVACY